MASSDDRSKNGDYVRVSHALAALGVIIIAVIAFAQSHSARPHQGAATIEDMQLLYDLLKDNKKEISKARDEQRQDLNDIKKEIRVLQKILTDAILKSRKPVVDDIFNDDPGGPDP